MFLTFSQDERLPPVAQALCQQFVDFKETRFATPSLATPWGNHNPEEWTHQRSKLYLTWASLNVRSIYGREKTLTELMQQNQISVLALQETFERVNDPPEGLPRSTYSKPGDNARRGVMLVVHPSLEKAARSAPELGGDNPNILWVQLDIGDASYFAASIYLPDNSKSNEADEVVKQLLADIEAIPREARVIIMGDWNYDPFSEKGKNKVACKKLMIHPRLALLRRSSSSDCTRPAASTHIDNLLISKSVGVKTTSPIFYLHIPPHGRTPSDHLLLGFRSSRSGRRKRMRTTELQYDSTPLRDTTDHNYSRVLDELGNRWLTWAPGLSKSLQASAASSNQEAELLFAGLKLTIYSAAFQTLPTKRKKTKSSDAGTMATVFASGKSRKEMWKVVSKRIKAKTCGREVGPLTLEMEQKLREQGAKIPASTCQQTKKWVRTVMAKLDADVTPPETFEGPSFGRRVEIYYQTIVVAIKDLRWKTAGGLDGISAAQVKRAPHSFLRALAVFAARCACLKQFPRWIRLARAKFIPKPEAGKFRGLRLESLLTKLVEKCILHPFFPSLGPDPGLIAPEHFADRKGVSAEMTAGILSIIIDAHRGVPLFVIIADAKEAFDNVWRDALWAKLSVTHKCTDDIRSARALYEHMDAQIVEDNFKSDIIELCQGVPQGGPRSGKLFALFNSDVPDMLRNVGAGTAIGEVDITCAIFMDDSMIPAHTVETTRKVLQAMANYGDQWSQQWAPAKSKVLCLNVSNPPAQWLFREQWIDSVTKCKYLGVHFDPAGGWAHHFAMKKVAAILTRLELRRAGLIGGRNAPADSLEIVRAMLWPTIDHGRGVASSQGPKCKAIAKALDAFQLETLREILGVSKSCRIAGVRGELGEIPDLWRERKRQISVARQMLTSPRGGLIEQIARQANSATPKLGIFRTVQNFLEAANGPSLQEFHSKGDIKRWITSITTQEWRARVESSSCLTQTYRHTTTLATRGYLRRSFPGRTILTRLRLDDLDLGAAGYRGRAEAKQPCAMCDEEAETREHFALRCRSLAGARTSNSQVMSWVQNPPQHSDFDVLILASPRGAEDDIKKAVLVGKLFHDLWTLRTNILGIKHTLT
jgi:hypothetical protein